MIALKFLKIDWYFIEILSIMGLTQKLLRKKVVEEAESSDLNRILGTFGLTTLGKFLYFVFFSMTMFL